MKNNDVIKQESEKMEIVKMLKESFLNNKEAAQKNIIRSFENFCVSNGYDGIFFTPTVYVGQTGDKKEKLTSEDILNMFLGVASLVIEFAQSHFPTVSTEDFKKEIVSVVDGIIQAVIIEHGIFVFRYDIKKPNFLNKKSEVINLVPYLSAELGKIK